MQRLTTKDNQITRTTMAKLLKEFIIMNGSINFTNGSRLFVDESNKLRYSTIISEASDSDVIKKWGSIKFEDRQKILSELECNPRFKVFAKEFMDKVSEDGEIHNYLNDRDMLNSIISIYFRDVKNALKENNFFHTSDIGTPMWGGMQLATINQVYVKQLVENLIRINISFTLEANDTIKEVFMLREKFKSFDKLLDPKVVANKEKVGTILKGYLASGGKIHFLEIDNPSGKLVFVGPMMYIDGNGYKKWGSISWKDRVAMLRSLVNDKSFVEYAYILSR